MAGFYNYNGYILPDISPVLTRTGYLYIVVVEYYNPNDYYNSPPSYSLRVSDFGFQRWDDDSGATFCKNYLGSSGTGLVTDHYQDEFRKAKNCYRSEDGTEWEVSKSNINYDKGFIDTRNSKYKIVWSNCTITNRSDGSVYYAADSAPIGPIVAETPKITKDLPVFGSATYEQGSAVNTLSIEASVSDGGTLTYQWFQRGLLIEGATTPEYTPTADTVGTFVYSCKVTNTITVGLTAFAYSRSFKVVVTEVDFGGGGGGGWDDTDPHAGVKSLFMSGLAAGAAMYSGTILIGSDKVTLPGATGGDPFSAYPLAFKSGFFTGLALYGHAIERVVVLAEQTGETLTLHGAYSAAKNGKTLEVT